MEIKNYFSRLDFILSENRFHRIILTAAMGIIVTLVFVAAEKEEIVVLQPITLTETAYVQKNEASINYMESWGHYLSLLMGNITPGNLKFIKERLEPIISPDIYSDVMVKFESQAADIKKNRASFNFQPQRVSYDKELNRVFVMGNSVVKGPMSRPKKIQQTYEYEIFIENYLPRVTFIDLYQGMPHDSVFIQKQVSKVEQDKKKERK